MENSHPIVLISYSWDNEPHKEWVLNLATKLVQLGIDVILDRWEMKLGKLLPDFMESSIIKAERVICVMTPNYKIKAANLKKGVGYEYSIITGEAHKNVNTIKYIPILRSGNTETSIPSFLQGRNYLDMSDDTNFNDNLEDLIRDIYKKPKCVKPALGPTPNFVDDKNIVQNEHVLETLDFRKITFGSVDAKTESTQYPDLIKKGYINLHDILEHAKDKSTFLFLGYKGSGKSSLSEHLHLENNENIIVNQDGLKNLSYKTFYKIIPGDAEKERKTSWSWKWILLIKMLLSLRENESCLFKDNGKLKTVQNFLVESGINSKMSISELVRYSSTNKFKGDVQNLIYTCRGYKENAENSIYQLINLILDGFATCTISKQQLLILDDIDDILTSDENQFKTIASLVNTAAELNDLFINNSLSLKIIILCRTDIFDRLPDPNKNKLRQARSYIFSWYSEGISNYLDNDLVKMANIRAHLSYPSVVDIFASFFPSMYKKHPIAKALLEFTRHTPRDFIKLLCCIQNACTSQKVSETAITKGINDYSLEYLLCEIKDEMAGYLTPKQIEDTIAILTNIHKREFKIKDFEERAINAESLKSVDSNEVMKILYDCSAIGNTYQYNDTKTTHIMSKYRNPSSSFSNVDTISLHKGLWKALSVNY